MDPTLAITSILTLIIKLFPSLSDYSQYIISTAIALITFIGIFTNILPEPGHKFTVPDVEALKIELQGQANFILNIAKFTRNLVVISNWFINTSLYKGFYNTTNAVTKLLPWMKNQQTKKA